MKVILPYLNFGLILLMTFLLAKKWNVLKNKLYWSSFFCHLIGGLAVGLVYKYYYPNHDTWVYFENAVRVANIGATNLSDYITILFDFSEIQNPIIESEDFRSVIFIKILSVFCLMGGNSYWICTAYFSLLAFISSWFLFKIVIDVFPDSQNASALAFLFFPSIVFWSSGVLKEALALPALYFSIGIFLMFFYGQRPEKAIWILLVFSCAFLWILKYYWAAVFFITTISAIITKKGSERLNGIKGNLTLTFFSCFFLIGIAASYLHPNFYLERFLEVIVSNHNEFVSISDDENLIHYINLKPTIISVLANSPWAVLSGVFRPIIGEGRGLFGLIASIENLFVLFLFIGSLLRLKDAKLKPSLLFWAAISYCVVLSVFLALSTPNLGTLSRYRVGFSPVLIFVLAYQNPLFELVLRKFGFKK
ncbi:MAG: hypothetical protein QM734_12690 [Cyclobacteriaceae bacterium]